jgi:23S rRNA pseudouridine2605 synthase
MTQDNKPGERIAKVIARAGLASRREAEDWIAAGRVAVNGTVIDSPALDVTAHDRVSVDDKPLPARERTRLFLYHKPRGLLTSHGDPQGRPTIFQHLPKHLPRLISVGRLDFNTEGLILLTNDGALARILELPATGWLRRYRVRAHGAVTQQQLDQLRACVTIDGIRYREIEATLDRVQGSNLWLSFAIREGKNREVRSVLGHLGLAVTRLIRVSFGPFRLGELAEGAIEEVRTRVLREQIGERVVALSGADFSAPIVERAAGRDSAHRPQVAAQPPLQDERPERPGRRPSRLASRAPAGDGESGSRRNSRARPKSPSHAWRAPEPERPPKKLKRKFRGSRSDETPRRHATGAARPDVLTDRKGRPVLVERFGQPAADGAPERPHRPPKPHRPSNGGRRRFRGR